MKCRILNKRGDSVVPTALLILVFSLILSVALFYAYVGIQTTVIRNAMNKGLSNLAVTISEDTYTALRESDFDAYVKKLTGTSSYRTKLTETYRSDLLNTIALSDERYQVDAVRLDFEADGKKLTYTCTCDVTFRIRLLGKNVTAAVRSVQVSGTHNAKYGK